MREWDLHFAKVSAQTDVSDLVSESSSLDEESESDNDDTSSSDPEDMTGFYKDKQEKSSKQTDT
eukprot:6206401-Karenia_brevis.AAC.1